MKQVPNKCPKEKVRIWVLYWIQLRIKNLNLADTEGGILKSVASIYDPRIHSNITVTSQDIITKFMKGKDEMKPLKSEICSWNMIQYVKKHGRRYSYKKCYSKKEKSNKCQFHRFKDDSIKA